MWQPPHAHDAHWLLCVRTLQQVWCGAGVRVNGEKNKGERVGVFFLKKKNRTVFLLSYSPWATCPLSACRRKVVHPETVKKRIGKIGLEGVPLSALWERDTRCTLQPSRTMVRKFSTLFLPKRPNDPLSFPFLSSLSISLRVE